MTTKWILGLVAIAVIGMALAGAAFVLLGIVGTATCEVVDSVVSEVRIDDDGVRLGETRYEVDHGRRGRDRVTYLGEDIVRFGDDIIVEEDELVDGDVVTIFGSIVVDGAVEGDVVAVPMTSLSPVV